MTNKQQRFCEEYVIDLNATQAAIRAGYSEKTADQQASRLLTNVKVQILVQKFKSEISKRNEVTVDKVVKGIAEIATFDIAELYDENGALKNIHDIRKSMRTAISGIKVFEEFTGFGKDRESIGFTKDIRIINKLDAYKELMKYFGGYEKDNEQKKDKVPSREERDKFLKSFKEELKKSMYLQ